MSFSIEVRNELARLQSERKCCKHAELTALLRMGGTMLIGGAGRVGLTFSTENAAVARKVLMLIRQQPDVIAEITVARNRRLHKNNRYSLRLPPSATVTNLLAGLGLLEFTQTTAAIPPVRRACCRRSYLRGAFLGGGSVNRPEGDYHLELVSTNQGHAEHLIKLLKQQNLSAGLAGRKQDYVVYLKDGNAVSEFLGLVGAHQAVMKFENVRIVKDMRNQVNRLVNCETANLEKTVNAAVRQIDAIRLIQQTIGLASLSSGLQETAQLRLEFPEASLQELVNLSSGQLGKSGIRHRLRRLEEIAVDIAANTSNKE